VNYPRLISYHEFLLVGVKVNAVDRTVGLVDLLTGQVPHLEVPDPCRAVLSPGVHPAAVLLEPDRHDVLASLVVDDRVEVVGGEVEHPDVLVSPRSYRAAIPGYGEAVDRTVGVLESSGGGSSRGGPELDGVIVPGSGQDHGVCRHGTLLGFLGWSTLCLLFVFSLSRVRGRHYKI